MRRNSKKRKLTSSSSSGAVVVEEGIIKGEEEEEVYPNHCHPTAEECRRVRDALLGLHGFPKQFESYRQQRNNLSNQYHDDDSKRSSSDDGTKRSSSSDDENDDGNSSSSSSILDGLISTLLSQNTTDANSARAFLSLKSAFPSWQQVVDAEPKMLEDAIRCGGLAPTKAARIQSILRSVRDKRGEFSLEYLRRLPLPQVKAELSRFKGIGPKTVACVLMFNLQQEDFPVDTHVFRITKALGWIPVKADREKAYLHLNKRIPDELKFDLNCLLVTHGKLCDRCVKKRGDLQGRGSHTCPLEYTTDVSRSPERT